MALFTEAGDLIEGLVRLDGQPCPKLGFFQKRKLKKAKPLLQQAALESPENGAPYLMLAKVEERLGEHEDYLSSLQKSWLLEPGNLVLVIELSSAYGQLGKQHEAISVLIEGRKYYPSEPRILFNLGVSFLLINQSQSAKDIFVEMIEIEPDYEMNHKMLAYSQRILSGDVPAPNNQSDIAKGI
ncbi:MAG: hypothetical protein COA46_07280 [Porticoccaceae bacterium]|nr:MAG: hypothetical protein COA46_07280 [Porticoccaceae bacterium]